MNPLCYNGAMNLHVIAVHFPIALLTIYALLEFIRWRKATALPYWFYLKAFLVILGFLAAIKAAAFGKFLTITWGVPVEGLILKHALAATTTIIISGFIALLYLLAWLDRSRRLSRQRLQKLGALTERPVMVLFAFIVLGAITITGALGGIIAFGPDTDPFARFLYDTIVQ